MKNLIIAITLVLMSCGHTSDSATSSSESARNNVTMHLSEKSALSLTDNGIQGVGFSYLETIAYSHTVEAGPHPANGGSLPDTWTKAHIRTVLVPVLKAGGVIDITSLPDNTGMEQGIPNGFSMDFLVVTIEGPAVISDDIMYGGQSGINKTILDGLAEWSTVKYVQATPTWPTDFQTSEAKAVFVRNDWIGEAVTMRLKPMCDSNITTGCVSNKTTKEIGFTSRNLSESEQSYVDLFVHDIVEVKQIGSDSVFYFIPTAPKVVQNETLDIKMTMDFSDITVTPETTAPESTSICNTTWDQEKAKYIAEQQALLLPALNTWNSTQGILPENMRTQPMPVMPTLPAEWQTSEGWVCPTASTTVIVTQKTQDAVVLLGSSEVPFNISTTYLTTPVK